MMEIKNINEIKKKPIRDVHGDATLYQRILGGGTDKPDLMSTIRNVWRMTVPPGETNRIHTHENEEQVYVILKGDGIIQVGEERRQVRAGDAIYLPNKIGHAFVNNGKGPTVILAFGSEVKE